MYGLIMAIQNPPPMASAPSGLATANILALAVLLVALGLGLLLAANYYRRKGNIDQLRARRKRNETSGEASLVSQYAYMSRDELKEMILKEKQAVECAEGDAPKPEVKAPVPVQVKDETALIADLSLALAKESIEKEGKECKEEPPKKPLMEGVERSALSTELPEEFRKKSRKI
jgi:hypothetical protein